MPRRLPHSPLPRSPFFLISLIPVVFLVLIVDLFAPRWMGRPAARAQESANSSRLVLKSCCGPNCEEFQRPEEMYGITCCGDEPSNQFEEICCDNVPRRRRQPSSFIDRCCGNQTLAYDQTCCQGVVHNIPSGECCGRMAYPRNAFNTLCCEESLITNVDASLTCCGKNAYDGGKREICCGAQVFLKELFDGCCPIFGKNPPEYREFNTRTHQCCDQPIERIGTTKCCYLKDPQGRFFPSSYDSATECCQFPFTAITKRAEDGSCEVQQQTPGGAAAGGGQQKQEQPTGTAGAQPNGGSRENRGR